MSRNREQVGIGLMGLGVVGSGVARVLTGKVEKIAAETGCNIVLKKILEKDVSKHGNLGIRRELFTLDPSDLFKDPEIDIIIELIGGEHPAYELVTSAIASNKHVVTANKELLAKHGYEILKKAYENKVDIRYEASVGGGIPLISPFLNDLIANDITAIYGIVNGTTNYILSRMAQESLDFSVALKQAQKLGYAEANPENDIEGKDAAYKLAILASIAFETEVKIDDVYCEGISRLRANDFRYAKELGYSIKLLAVAKKSSDAVEVHVHPVFISEDALLAKVNGVYNAIEVEGDLVGKIIFYGRGAGSEPTSSAIVADVINIAQNICRGVQSFPKMAMSKKLQIRPIRDIETRGYIRLSILDQSGVLAQISKVLGDNLISISSVIQKETDDTSKTAEIVIMTHPAKEAGIQKALTEIKNLSVVKEVSNYIRIEG